MSGIHYLDTTNELGYVFRARGYQQIASRTGAALIPACAFEVALADCASHLAVSPINPSKSHPLDELNVVYVLDGNESSSGTRLSTIRSLATSWIAYRDGTWTGGIPGASARRFPLPSGVRYTLNFPSCESITFPLQYPVRRVDCWMATRNSDRLIGPILIPALARLSRSILRGLILRIASGSRKDPKRHEDAFIQNHSPFTIYIQASRGSATHWAVVSGHDPYGLTAAIITYAARKILEPGFSLSGLLAPAQAFDPEAFLQHARQSWNIQIDSGEISPQH